MKKLLLFLILLLLTAAFSACADSTGVSIHGGEASCATESANITQEAGKIITEEITASIAETQVSQNGTTDSQSISETVSESQEKITVVTEIISTEAITEFEETTEAFESEIIPEETTAVPETEAEFTLEAQETAENIDKDNGNEYLLNTNSKKFHYLSCKSGQKTKETNRKYHTGTRDEVIAMGYVPCKVCNP